MNTIFNDKENDKVKSQINSPDNLKTLRNLLKTKDLSNFLLK